MKWPLSLLMLGLLSLGAVPAAAQQPSDAARYPVRAVKVIVPNGAGAALDIIGRILAQKLSELTGGQFYVEDLPGAGGTIGMGNAARAPADGYTLLMINQDFVVQPSVKSKVPYDLFNSFTPIGSVAEAPETISVHPSVPATNMQELIALLRANPGMYSYATPGHGTSPHVASERLFKLTYGLDVIHVPFQGGAPAVTSTIAGHTQILHITLPLVAAYIKEGRLRALAVADKRRSPELPDVPTLEESGIPNHEVGYWTGLVVPAGTPMEVVEQLRRHITKIVTLPDVKERLTTLGFRPLAGTPEQLAAYIKSESTEWARVIREAKIKVD
jgi:tripartite-type tricarboxylate transporter receptor subunit TctC